jgi:hypothetical protein
MPSSITQEQPAKRKRVGNSGLGCRAKQPNARERLFKKLR